jgi:hypothetical protein
MPTTPLPESSPAGSQAPQELHELGGGRSMTDITAEINVLRDTGGENWLTAGDVAWLHAAVNHPDPAAWRAAAGLTVGKGLTLWQACREVEPWLAKRYADTEDIPIGPISPAIIVAALRHATDTTAQHQQRALQRSWPSLRAYYKDDPVREGSPERDYGEMWTADGDRAGWPRWRVSYVTLTGEVYSLRLAADGLVVVVGIAYCRDDADQKLGGWADPDISGHDLAWAFHRFGRTLPAQVNLRVR